MPKIEKPDQIVPLEFRDLPKEEGSNQINTSPTAAPLSKKTSAIHPREDQYMVPSSNNPTSTSSHDALATNPGRPSQKRTGILTKIGNFFHPKQQVLPVRIPPFSTSFSNNEKDGIVAGKSFLLGRSAVSAIGAAVKIEQYKLPIETKIQNFMTAIDGIEALKTKLNLAKANNSLDDTTQATEDLKNTAKELGNILINTSRKELMYIMSSIQDLTRLQEINKIVQELTADNITGLKGLISEGLDYHLITYNTRTATSSINDIKRAFAEHINHRKRKIDINMKKNILTQERETILKEKDKLISKKEELIKTAENHIKLHQQHFTAEKIKTNMDALLKDELLVSDETINELLTEHKKEILITLKDIMHPKN